MHRHRTACSAEDCQNDDSFVPAAAPAVNARARTRAVPARSHPRNGDHRNRPGTPPARPCGSNTATGPTSCRALRVTARLSGRVEVVTTAPGAPRIIGTTTCKPLPDRGGPTTPIESSTDTQHSTPRDRPKRTPTSAASTESSEGRSIRPTKLSRRSLATALIPRRDKRPRILASEWGGGNRSRIGMPGLRHPWPQDRAPGS